MARALAGRPKRKARKAQASGSARRVATRGRVATRSTKKKPAARTTSRRRAGTNTKQRSASGGKKRLTRTEQRAELRKKIMSSLRKQGFKFRKGQLVVPEIPDKEAIRTLHSVAVNHRKARSQPYLQRHEPDLLKRIANGYEVVPEFVSPKLVEVLPGTEDERLFRYVSLHWSIPVSSGYGRRIRFLVIDEQNDKLIGAFGLGDPVFNLGARDDWIGWDRDTRADRLQNVMEAFLIGAVPPYNLLLGGKLVAMLLASNEVRRAFRRKYEGSSTVIRGRRSEGKLALITTISALGRSSIYNRVAYDGRKLYESLGFTRGYGEFHFSDGLYPAISSHAAKWCTPTAKAAEWGTGFRNRREVVKKCLVDLQLPTEWVHHGIRREVFAVPLANKTKQFLRGEITRPGMLDLPASELSEAFLQRWLLRRAAKDGSYSAFMREDYRLWPKAES